MKNAFFCGLLYLGLLCPLNAQQWIQHNLPTTSSVTCMAAPGGTALYVGTYSGIYFSGDDGNNWIGKNNGLPTSNSVLDIAVNFIGDKLFAVVKPGSFGEVYASADGGANWEKRDNGCTGSAFSTSALFMIDTCIFAGAHEITPVTYDPFIRWSTLDLTDVFYCWSPSKISEGSSFSYPEIKALVAAGDGSSLYAATRDTVYYSSDGGKNWNAANNGLPGKITSLAISGSNVFAGTEFNGVFISTDNGSSWSSMNAGLSGSNLKINTLLVAGSYLYAGTDYGQVFAAQSASGIPLAWQNTGLYTGNVYALAISQAGILFAGANNGRVYSSNIVMLNEQLSQQDYQSSFKISPNPCFGSAIIEIIDPGFQLGELTISDVFGKKVYRQFLNSMKKELELDLSPGIYFYTVNSKDKSSAVEKLIIQ